MVDYMELLNSPLTATVAGAALGALSGKDKRQTTTTAPELPENVRQGFNQLLEMSQPERVAYQPAPTERYYGMGTIFDSPEMQRLQDISDVKAFEALLPRETAQPSPDPMPATNMVQVDQPMMRGIMEAQRRASMPTTPSLMTAEQLRQYKKDAASGLAPNQAQALLNPSSEGFTNEFTGAKLNREDVLRALGELNLAGDPMNLRYASDTSNEAIQGRMASRDEALQGLKSLMAGINYQPPKTSFGRMFGSTILPMVATAAFGAGLPAGLPFSPSNVRNAIGLLRSAS